MIKVLSKDPRTQLSPEAYRRLKIAVLNRDGWHCQNCGSSQNLEVHHQQFRSHSGDDAEDNLIMGWTRGWNWRSWRRENRQGFDCATWLHKARSLSKERFKQEVEKELTRRETEPWEIIYFKLYKGQIPVIEPATETAALMLGSDKSRGYFVWR